MAGNMPLTRSRKRSLEESNVEVPENEESIPECAVCLQECSHPCRLPCGHIFCFLCVKGVSLNQANCPMCRASIPRGYFDNPDILSVPKKTEAPSSEGFKWYYEGRHGGWWEYDRRTSGDLEEAFKAKERSIQVLIAGTIYTIDLIQMVQKKQDGRSSRRVKRSQPIPSKGVAGIRKHRRLPERPSVPALVLEPLSRRLNLDDDYDDDDYYEDDYDPSFDDEYDSEFDDDDIYEPNHVDDPEDLSSESEPEIFDDAEPYIHDDPEPVIISDASEISEPEISDVEPGSQDESSDCQVVDDDLSDGLDADADNFVGCEPDDHVYDVDPDDDDPSYDLEPDNDLSDGLDPDADNFVGCELDDHVYDVDPDYDEPSYDLEPDNDLSDGLDPDHDDDYFYHDDDYLYDADPDYDLSCDYD